MGVFFYNIFLWLYHAGIRVSALFNPKAKKWVRGRKNVFTELEKVIPAGERIVWMHCSSLGEFEQGRPVIENIKKQIPHGGLVADPSGRPNARVLLTFFSPSGYEVQKNYKGADWVFYLPMDSPRNAKRFLEIVQPSLVIFVKYEFWYYYLKKIKYRNIPLLLISAVFRKDMSFFKWYGKMMRKMLSRFDHLFVQNEGSKQLMENIGLTHICTVSGDTRFDRVIEIAQQFQPIPAIEKFIGHSKAIVAGSTWPEDELVLQKALTLNNSSFKLIIAPHEINDKHLADISKLFPGAVRFSQLSNTPEVSSANCLIIDNYGMLSRLYQYGYVTYVGGGLVTNGVHNVLEAAVYERVVLFGPYYHKYSEAVGLVQSGGGISFNDEKKNGEMLAQLIDVLDKNEDEYASRSIAAGEYVRTNGGATQKIVQYIQEKRLLTN